MQFPERTRQAIARYLGDSTGAFLSSAEALVDKYTKQWQLTQLSFMPTETVNLLFECDSVQYGACVLKICIPGSEVATEINCLRAYDGNGYVKLWDYELTDHILLLERVIPGEQMWAVADYRERARLMAKVVKDLPIITANQNEYPTYRTWMERVHGQLTDRGNMEDALFYLDEALRVYDELKTRYRRSCLLHGDMHQENMLLNAQGGYTIIDPKGVIDDPVMETARFLMNETPCEAEKVKEMVSIMAPIIDIPEIDILGSMYVDAALGSCWTFNEHFPTQEALEEGKRKALASCSFVYGLMDTE